MNSHPKRQFDAASEDSRIKKLLQEHHRLNTQVEDLEDALRFLTTSKSWKITAPLRKGRLIIHYLLSFFSPRKHFLFFSVATGAALKGTHWLLSDRNAQLTIASSKRRMPVGWARFNRCEPSIDTPSEFALYIDEGEGFSEHSRQRLKFDELNSCLVRLPRLVRGLRVDPLDAQQKFTLVGFQVREHYAVRILTSKLFGVLRKTPLQSYPQLLLKSVKTLWHGGGAAFQEQILGERLTARDRNKLYKKWVKRYDTLTKNDILELERRASALLQQPLVTVLMPVYNSPERWLREALSSVLKQAYENWELCIADDASTRPSVRKVLEEYCARDSRIRVTFRSENGHISRASNTALEMARGEYVVLMDHDDVLPAHALYHVVKEINKYPDVDLIFSDEDRLSETGQRIDPYFKLGWDAELFRSQNLISHLGVYRTAIARKIGGFRAGYEGSQDWDFALRFIENIPSSHIRHIPRVLYHWRMVPGTVSFSVDTKIAAFSAAELCVQDHLTRLGVEAAVSRDPDTQSNRIRYRLKGNTSAVTSIRYQTDCSKLLNDIGHAQGEYILFLHEATRGLDAEHMDELLSRLEQPGVAIVAGRIWSADNLLSNAGYRPTRSTKVIEVHAGLPVGDPGYFGRAMLAHEVWAVGLNGMLTRKTDLQSLDNQSLQNPEDLAKLICLHVRESGKKIIWTPFASFASHSDVQERLKAGGFTHPLHDEQLSQESFCNPNLADDSTNYALAFPPQHLN